MSGDHADTGCFFAILVSLSNCSKTKSSPFNLEGAAYILRNVRFILR